MVRILVRSALLGSLILFAGLLVLAADKSAPQAGVLSKQEPVTSHVKITGASKTNPGSVVMLQLQGTRLDDLIAEPPKLLLTAVPQPDMVAGVYDYINRQPAIMFQASQAGNYYVIVSTTIGGKLQLLQHRIQVGTVPPGPGPGPEPGPEPGPTSDWAKYAKATAEAAITHPKRAEEAKAIAKAIKAATAQAAAGGYGSVEEYRGDVKRRSVDMLIELHQSVRTGRDRAMDWDQSFDKALGEEIARKVDVNSLDIDALRKIHEQIANGLEQVQ